MYTQPLIRRQPRPGTGYQHTYSTSIASSFTTHDDDDGRDDGDDDDDKNVVYRPNTRGLLSHPFSKLGSE